MLKNKSGAFFVASGIFLSRVFGFLRESFFAYYLGNSDAADAFKAALRIPNFLQNLFGEGVLSASFIPVYAKLRAEGKNEEAAKLAGTIASLLFVVSSLLVALGVTFSGALVDIITPGFSGEKRELARILVQILFPGAGLLVMSAWCLGVLNSHRRFFLSYAAPVIWNVTIIFSLWLFGGTRSLAELSKITAWGVVAGSLLQFLIQLPTSLKLLSKLYLSLSTTLASVRLVIKNFVPVFFGRGVVQISAYVDSIIASLLPAGALAALTYAQVIYLLPISLFGMSISAAELPEMSSALGTSEEIKNKIRTRLEAGFRRLEFYVLPAAAAFLFAGDSAISILYQRGEFSASDTILVWTALIGASFGLLPATFSRLLSSSLYATNDTKTPFKISIARVLLGTLLGFTFSLYGPTFLGIDESYGILGLTLAASLSSFVEFFLLSRAVRKNLSTLALFNARSFKVLSAALCSSALGFFLKPSFLTFGLLPGSLAIVFAIGISYLGFARVLHISEAKAILRA